MPGKVGWRPAKARRCSNTRWQIVADWMEPAYGFHSLFNFKRKFQPAEAPVYVCTRDPAALPQIGLAVVRAYVPSVTPAEVAGMLSTLRS